MLFRSLGIGSHRRGRDELGRLAASFTVMMRALDDSLQAQRRLVADASHELRTPLTSLTTNLDLLDEISDSPDPLTPELVRDARTQAHELRTLVNDLIDLARFTSVETHVEDTRLDLLAQQAVKRTRDLATARTRGIDFESRLEECLVLADPDALQRAIQSSGAPLLPRPVQSGLHLVADLDGVDADCVFEEAKARGVEVMPLSHYYFGGGTPENALVLGIAAVRPAAIRAGVSQLALAIEAARGRESR